MATEIGIIKTLIGTAVATAADGSQRNLQAGDRVFQDEIITTGAAGAVEVEFTDGSVMTLGRSSQTVLDTETFNPLDVAEAPADAESEVDALQQALLEGADPTQIGEATAAGAGAGGSGNEGSDFVTVDYLAPSVIPESGFDTTGISFEFDEIEEELPAPIGDVPTLSINDVTVFEPSGNGEYSGEDGGSPGQSNGSGGGGIFVTGHDSDEHSNIDYMSSGLDYLLFGQAVTVGERAGKTVAVIGDGSSAGFVSGLTTDGWTVTYYIDGDPNITDAFNADAVLVESGNDSSLNTQLIALTDDFTDYINNGGALYINTDEGGGQSWYDFVPSFGDTINTSLGGTGVYAVTGAGSAIGLTEPIVDADPTHSYFTGVDTSLFTIFEVADSDSVFGQDNGAAVAFGSNNIIIGDGGFQTGESTFAEFTVSLSSASDVDVLVDFVTADGTAIFGGSGVAENDYGATSGTVTIPAGSLSATIQVEIFGDNVTEITEQYFVTLSAPVNATIADGTGIGTILDNDLVEFSIEALSGSEGGQQSFVDEGDIASYTISYDGTLADGVQAAVTFDTASGTTVNFDAIEGVDFDESTGTLVFTGGSGVTSVVVFVQTTGDSFVENDENYSINLISSSANSTIDPLADHVDTTILDDDPVTFDISVASETDEAGTQVAGISEENDADDTGTFTVSRGGGTLPAGNEASVTITVTGSAEDADFEGMSGSDYADIVAAIQAAAAAANLAVTGVTGSSLTVTWDSTDGSSFNVDLTAFDDDLTDSPEGLTLTLSAPSVTTGPTPTITNTAATLNITDVDQAITITIADTQTTITEEGGETDTFTISLSEAMNSGNTVTVDVDFATGSDTEDADFIVAAEAALLAAANATTGVSYASGTLTYSDTFVGTDLSFDVTAFDDDLLDSPETLNVTLDNATAVNGSATAADSEDVTITDTDQAITITIADTQTTITEEGGETDTFTISLSEAMNSGNTVTVDVDFATGSDTEDADFIVAAEAALLAAANATTGVSYASGTLTYSDTFVGTDLSFDVTAFDDDLLDSPETLNVTLDNATAVNGSATAADSEDVTITDIDNAITFALNVTSEVVGDDTATQQATVTEENDLDDLATFTVLLTGLPLTGANTASVDINFTGTSEDADFVTAALASLSTVAGSTDGVSLSGNTLTFTSSFVGSSLSFGVEAFDDGSDEGPEDLIATLSNELIDNGSVGLVGGQTVATVDILDDDGAFPSGLAYTVAGSKNVDGEQLYAVDLETGSTVRVGEVLVNGVALGPNSTSGMALSPSDGFLYAVAKQGGSSWLLRIDPTSAETTVIDDVNSFSKASAATFGTDGTYYLAFGNEIFTHNLVGTLTLIAEASPSASFDAMAINLDGTIMYLAVGDDLWQVAINPDATIEVPTLIGQITDGTDAYSPDGLSFDDNGALWALDNAGNILRLQLDGTAENVITLAVNEVTGNGAHSLAISSVDPGTYIVLSEGADSKTLYLDDDFTTTPNILTETDLFGTLGNVDMAVDAAGAVTISQDTGDANDVTSVFVQSDDDGQITVNDFENVDVQVRGHDSSALVINDAESGNIDMGEGDDSVTINNTTGTGTFTINTDGGNDTITLSDLIDSSYIIDAGEYQDGTVLNDDIDTVEIDDDLVLGDGTVSLSNVEIVDITGSGNNTLTLTAADVLDATDTGNILAIKGDTGDALVSGDTWTAGTTGVTGVDGGTYDTYTSGSAILYVDTSIDTTGL